MKIHRRLMGIAVVVSVVAGCQAPAPTELTTQDAETLRGIFDTTVSTVLAGDWAGWAGQYSEDAVLQPPNAPSVSGRAAIQAWGEAFPALEDMSFSNVQVMGQGDMAYGMSGYVMTFEDAPTDTGKQLAVFRRTPSGGWEVVAVSFSSDLPAAVVQ